MWVFNSRNLLCTFVISLVLCQSVFAASCQQGCPNPNKSSKYKFQPGNVYTYELDSFVQVQLTAEEVDAQQTTLKIDGKVEVYAADNCQYTLKVLSLTSFAPDGKKSQFGADITKPVQFTLSNDELLPELCTESSDSDFSLNVKRGIISLLQSAEGKSFETDIFGVCHTSFSNFATGGATVVNKVRDLAGCGYRETLSNPLVTSVVNSKSGVKATPLLNSNYNSQQTFKNGILESVKLTEEYKYVPYAKLNSGALAKVTTKLTYTGAKAGSAPALASGVPRSVIFEKPHPDSQTNLEIIKQELKTVVDSYNNNNVGKLSASQFIELIRLMRFSKKDDILSLYQQVKAGTAHGNKSLARKVYLDALFRVGTGAAVEALANLYKNKEVSDAQEQKLMFISLNFVTSMSKPALKAAKLLLDGNPPREAYLSVGSLVNKYCQQHGCESADVKEISEKFAVKLGKCQPKNRVEEDIVVAVLKGVKNTNNLVSPLLEKVIVCTSEKSSSRIRVAAFQAYPAASCSKNIVNSALGFLKNANEDSEIRIQAYLSLVECPSAAVANELKAVLDSEKVYQVGSFITTHLASLRSSVDNNRDAARHHFANIRTTNKFPFDFRRYSFNREFSYAVESLGLGASADASVIYSQKSFLPKSVAFNFSTEVFGNGFNVFEVEGRQDNLDRVIEHYFGPKGFFRGMDLQTAFNTLVEQYGKLSQKAQSRFRRGLKEDVRAFAKTVNLHNDALDDFNLDVSVKFYGSELFFLSSGQNVPQTPEEFLDKLLECFDKFLEGAKKYDRVFEEHALFLDTDLVYPTAAGLPLKLSYEGAGVARLETSVEVDLKEIAKDYKKTKFNLKLVPSASYQLTGTLSVDAYTVSTGLQLSGTVHTATGSAVNFALLDDAKAYDLTIDSLFKKQELINFSSKLVFVTRERGNQLISIPLKMNQQVKEFKECFDNLYHIVGVTVCASAGQKQVPGKALVPLDGEYQAELYLEVDPKYHFSGKYDDSDKQHQSLLLTFDTPGTEKSRATSLKLESYFKGDAYVKATVLSPLRNVDVTIGLNNNEKEAALYALAHNGPDEYLAKVGFEKAGSAERQEYIPIFSVKSPSGDAQVSKLVQTTGKIIVEKGDGGATKYNLDNIEWTSPYAPKTTVNGIVTQNGPSFDTDVVILVGDSKNNVKGHLDFSPKHVNFDLEKKTDGGDANKNFKVDVAVAYSENSFKNIFIFVAGKDFNNPSNRYELNQQAEFELEDKKLTSLSLKNKLQLPKQLIRLDLITNKNHFKLDGEYGYDKYKVAANVDAKYNEKSAGDYDVTVGASLNKHFFKFFSKRTIDAAKSKFQNRLTASTGTKVEVNGVASNKFTEQEGELNLEGLFVAVEKADPYKLTLSVQLAPSNVLSNAKVLVGKDEFATYDLKVDRSENSNGKFNFAVKDFFDGNGEFKAKNGQGDGSALINFPKQDRKLKLDTKFKINAPIFDIATDFYYDFEKDNTKKVHFDTKNKVTKGSFDSKNKLEVFSEKYEFNVQGQQTGQPTDGTMNGKFSLTLPTGRQLSGDFKRDVDGKDEKKSTGSIVSNLVDKLPSGKQQSLSLTGNLKDGDFKARFFDMVHHLKYTSFEGKDIDLELTTKHQPVGHFKNAVLHVKVKGSLVPQESEFAFDLDEYCEQHAVYRLSGKYGSDFDGTVSGNYHVGKPGKAHSHEVKAKVNIPQAPMKTLALESKGTYTEPESETGLYELDYAGSFGYSDKVVAVSTNAKGNINHGTANVKVNLPDTDPLSADVQYNYEGKEDGPISTKGTLKVNYGNGKTLGFSGEAKAIGFDDISVHATLNSEFEHAKNVELTFKHVKSVDNAFNTKLNVIADDKTYSVLNAVVLSETSPSVDFNLGYPGKDVKVYGAYKLLSDRAFRAETKVLNFGDFNLDANLEANFQSYETFYAKAYVDAPKLNANKMSVEINSKPGSSGKGVEFKASSDGKNMLSGYADYSVKEQGKSTIIEGQGNVKLYDKQQQTASFKLTREKLQDAGYTFTLAASIDKSTVSTEVRIKPNDFYLKNKVCEKNQCTNLEIQSKLERTGSKFNHEALVSLDLQQLGYAHEFGLTAKTSGNGFTLDHTTDVQLKEKKQPKYQYLLYIHPNSAGASLILPTRSIVIEGVFKYPKDKFGHYDSTVSFYLDKKNAPANKATFGFTGETKLIGSAGVGGSGALKFSHPTTKDLVVSASGVLDGDKQTVEGKVELDLFKNANDKIIAVAKYVNSDQSFKGFNVSTEVSIASKGLGFDCGLSGHSALSLATKQLSSAVSINLPFEDFRFGSYLFASPEEIDFLLKKFNDELIRAHGTYDSKKNKAEFTTTMKLVPNRPIVLQSNINGFSSAKFSLNQDKFFNVDGTFAVDKAATFKVVGLEKELLNAKITLDASHFLSTEYQVNEENAKGFLQAFNKQLQSDLESTKADFEKKYTQMNADISKVFNNLIAGLPDVGKFQADYSEQLKKLQEELLQDPTIKEFFDFVTKIYAAINEVVGQLFQIYTENFKKISAVVTDVVGQLTETFNTKLQPILKDLYVKTEAILFSMYEETLKLVVAVFERSVKALKAFEDDFNKIAKNFSDQFKSFALTFNKAIATLDKEFKELYKAIQEYFDTFDEFKVLKETFKEYFDGLDRYAYQLLKELLTLAEDMYPVDEMKAFTASVNKYITAKLENKPVNDVEELKTIFVNLMKAINLLFDKLTASVTTSLDDPAYAGGIPSFVTFKFVPYISSFKFSPLNYLRNEKFLSLRDFLYQFRPYAWNPFAILPPFTMHGEIADGSHFFTFDGQHFTFAGSCQYVLASDFVDGNFSLVANVQNGKLKSVALIDKDVIELNDNGVVTFNGKATDLPLHKNELHAWRRFYTVNLLTTYGASVLCTTDLKVCHFTVSGFYLGKIRGLLGNGNYEPYDDFTLPSGVVSESSTDFANSYKTTKSCAAIAAYDHASHEHSSPLCSKFFGADSSLRYCFFFKDQTNFREACEHAVHGAQNPEEAACSIAFAYASACRLELIPVDVPAQCQKCSVGGKDIGVGDQFSVKSPQKQADVVLVVDTSIGTLLGELVQATINDLRKELKSSGIPDVHVVVLGYNRNQKYVSLYTSGGSLDFTGKLGQVDVSGPENCKALVTGNEKIDGFLKTLHELGEQVAEDVGATSDARAFLEALQYPFRPTASKSIVLVHSDDSEKVPDPTRAIKSLLATLDLKTKGVGLHVITPVKGLGITNSKDQKKVKEIVGFNSRQAFTLADSKKRTNIGSTELKNHLKYESDLLVDMVQKNDGYVFVLQNFSGLKQAKDKKSFVAVLASALGDYISRTEILSDCVCKQRNGLHAEESCEAKETKFLPPGKKAGGAKG
ncbi:apolipophorins [Topomyia yanbarensis]|uniref:apolipophorins n=1 Tax=Topomyia yanbarensis TaxID=2498891 RepID=UPI00273B0647|nr:apolipophorins [Topomyia yanbarensis]